jgi:hypothetical protein
MCEAGSATIAVANAREAVALLETTSRSLVNLDLGLPTSRNEGITADLRTRNGAVPPHQAAEYRSA